MIQEIVALTIVFAAVVYTGYSIIKSVNSRDNTECSSSCKCHDKKKAK